MKNLSFQTARTRGVKLAIFFSLLALCFVPTTSRACNLSYVQLDSVSDAGNGEWDIYVTACVGAGITGFSKGAAADTYTFAFVFYSSCVPNLTISQFPTSVKGDSTGAAYVGINFGPTGPPFNAQAAILYLSPAYQPFVCVGSAAACGLKHSQCDQYRFRVSDMPDSLRVLGFEGVGNAMGGCYPDADMMATLPLSGNPCGRSAGPAVAPKPMTGRPSVSPEADHFFVGAAEAAPIKKEIGLYPNPNAGVFALESGDPSIQSAKVAIYDMAGRQVAALQQVRMGETLDFGDLRPGSYFLNASGDGWQSSKMFVVR
jgi:hypothetical protein